MTHVTVSEAKGGSVINDSVEKEIGSLAWPGYSPPGLGFRTPEDRSSSVSPKRAHIPPGSDTLYLEEGRETERGWVGAGLVGIQAVPIVATVQLHLSQQRWDYFYKASDSVARQQSWLKTSAESTLKAEREDWMANGFLFVTLQQYLYSSFSPEAQPYGLTSAKCVLKSRGGPFHRPRSTSPHRPHHQHLLLLFFLPPLPSFSLLLHCLFHSLAGRVALLSLHRQDLWSQGLWQKQKGICQYLWETLCQPSSSSFHWCSQPH